MLPMVITLICFLTLECHGFCIRIMDENSLTRSKHFQELIEHDIYIVAILILCILHIYDKQ